jgi:hypothetical protein
VGTSLSIVLCHFIKYAPMFFQAAYILIHTLLTNHVL